MGRKVGNPKREVGNRHERHRDGDDPWTRCVGKPCGDDERTERVADHDDPHLDDAKRACTANAQANEERDASRTDDQAEDPGGPDHLSRMGQPVEDDGQDRDHGDEECGHGTAQPLLGRPHEEPGNSELAERIEGNPPHHRSQWSKSVGGGAPGEEDEGNGCRPKEDEGGRVDLADCHLDHQIRQTPDDAEGDEQHPATSRHGPFLADGQR